MAPYRGYGGSTSPAESARRQRQLTASIILTNIADLQGDVDAYMARYSAEQLTYGTIAPDVARRLIDADRLEEALGILQRARAAEKGKTFRASRYELDEVYEDCLQRMGMLEGAKSKRYRHAARHLEERRTCAVFIQDFAGFPTHAEFLAGLKLLHGRKYGFWEIVEG